MSWVVGIVAPVDIQMPAQSWRGSRAVQVHRDRGVRVRVRILRCAGDWMKHALSRSSEESAAWYFGLPRQTEYHLEPSEKLPEIRGFEVGGMS